MAEYGAHLTSAAGEDGGRPSFFEVLAQESLMSTLRPAVKHIIRILAEGNPYRFGWLYRHSEEFYSCVNLLLQHHFIRTTSASFAENFYGMKRTLATNSTNAIDTLAGLPRSEHIKSLVMLVLVPYLKLKLDALFERWQQQAWGDQPTSQMTWRRKLQRTFLTIYPFLHMTWEGVILAYQFRYLFRKSDCHSPYLHIAGVRLKYLSKEDILQQSKTAMKPYEALEDTDWRHIAFQYLQRGVGAVAIVISQGLSLGVFFLQFLEWWYMSESYQTQMAVTSLPIPTPPKIDSELINGDSSSGSDNLCPLCNKVRTNDTALSTSGYVFCYPCIFSHIKSHKRCPITNYPSEMAHLVKLYPPDG